LPRYLKKAFSTQKKNIDMSEIKITLESAKYYYSKADTKTKTVLVALLGKRIIGDIMDRIKTFEDACEELELDPKSVIPFPKPIDDDQRALNANAMLWVIYRALNEGWKPDWTNSNEYKYYPWFRMDSGSGLSFDDFGYATSASTVGSRLCLKSKELAEYAGEQFIDIYTELFIIK